MVMLSMSAAQNLAAIRQMTSGVKEGKKSKSFSLWKTVKLFLMPTRAIRSNKIDYGPKTHSEGFLPNNNCYVMVPILEGDNGNLGWSQVGTWYGEYSGIVLQRMIVVRKDFKAPRIWHVDSGIPMDLVFSHLTEECLAGYKSLAPEFGLEEFLTKWSDEYKPDRVQCINKYQLLAKMGSSRVHNEEPPGYGPSPSSSAQRENLEQLEPQKEVVSELPSNTGSDEKLSRQTGTQNKTRVIVKVKRKGENTKDLVENRSVEDVGGSYDEDMIKNHSTSEVSSWLASTAYSRPADQKLVGTFETTFHEVHREVFPAGNGNYIIPVATSDLSVNKFIQMNNHTYMAKDMASYGDYATQSGYINQSTNQMVYLSYLD